MEMTKHARIRMQQRGINQEAVWLAFNHGRFIYVRGAIHIAIGRKEIALARKDGLDLSAYEGITLVITRGHLLTVYRNRDFSHLRERWYRGRYRRAHKYR